MSLTLDPTHLLNRILRPFHRKVAITVTATPFGRDPRVSVCVYRV